MFDFIGSSLREVHELQNSECTNRQISSSHNLFTISLFFSLIQPRTDPSKNVCKASRVTNKARINLGAPEQLGESSRLRNRVQLIHDALECLDPFLAEGVLQGIGSYSNRVANLRQRCRQCRTVNFLFAESSSALTRSSAMLLAKRYYILVEDR